VDGEGAETYLRLLAEAQLRAATRGAGPDVAAASPWSGANAYLDLFLRAGGVLVAADLVTRESVTRVADELRVALALRSPHRARSSPGQLGWTVAHLGHGTPAGRTPARPDARPIRITPLGRTLRVADDRAPADLHLLTLVRTPGLAAITVVMRMHWPPDGSSADLEISGAGPQHLPYRQLWAADDRGARYSFGLSGSGGTAIWGGAAMLSPVPPPATRWLDLVADGIHRIMRLDLSPAPGADLAANRESLTVPVGDLLLTRVADRILATAWDSRGPAADSRLGEMTRVLADAGALAPGSRTPGWLAALCRELGADGHRISAPPAQEIPAPWASIVAQRQAPQPGPGPDVFAPLATILPDIDGTRFALAGLTSAAGQSHLHVVASGLPSHDQVDLPVPGWDPGSSWWLKDGAGRWHVATAEDPDTMKDGEAAFRLRLTPPLTSTPGSVELVVTGSSARIRAIAGVHGALGRSTLGT
jgi:hypothetical protein